MLTAAAQPGVLSLQRLSAGEYKYRIRGAFTSCIVGVSYCTLHSKTHRQIYRTRQDISQPMTTLGLICMLSGQHCTQGKAID